MSPTSRTLALLGLWLLLALTVAWSAELAEAWIAAGLGLLVVLVIDAARLRRAGTLVVERRLPPSVAIGTWSPVFLRLENRGGRRMSLVVHDHTPSIVTVRDMPRRLAVGAGEAAELEYGIYPTERGDHDFGQVELVLDSPFGLWRGKRLVGSGERLRIYPNFRAIMGYAWLARSNRTSRLGIRRRPRRGEGLDFHQLYCAN